MTDEDHEEVLAVTHPGQHHTDDAMAAGILKLVYGGGLWFERSHNPVLIAEADVVFDVGREYDEERLRFDHHQGASDPKLPVDPARPKGYASAGLVWKRFGREVCKKSLSMKGVENPSDSDITDLVGKVDKALMVPIDNWDNGIHPRGSKVIPIQHLVGAVSWRMAVSACSSLLKGSLNHFANSVWTRDILSEDLHKEGGPRVWIIGGHYILESAPDLRLDLGAAKYMMLERYGEQPLAVISPMGSGKWALLFNERKVEKSTRKAFSQRVKDVTLHASGAMAFATTPRRLVDAVKILVGMPGAFSK